MDGVCFAARDDQSAVGSSEVAAKVDIRLVLDSAGEEFDSHFLRIETALQISGRIEIRDSSLNNIRFPFKKHRERRVYLL